MLHKRDVWIVSREDHARKGLPNAVLQIYVGGVKGIVAGQFSMCFP